MTNVFRGSHPFKVFKSVISSNAVFMVNLRLAWVLSQERYGDNSVNAEGFCLAMPNYEIYYQVSPTHDPWL